MSEVKGKSKGKERKGSKDKSKGEILRRLHVIDFIEAVK